MENYKLIFINSVGKDSQDKYQYELMFSNDISIVWGGGWSNVPIGNCLPEDKLPHPSTYDLRKNITTDILLDLAQNNTCFSFQDCIDQITALAWENINNYEEYPNSRLVFHYGDNYNDVLEKLNERDIWT